MAMACRSRTPRRRTRRPASSSATSSSRVAERVGAGRPARAGRHRRRARALRRVRAVRRRPPVLRDRRARHPRRRQPRGDRRRRQRDLRAVVLDVDHDRGVPQPAGDLGRTASWYTTPPFSEPEVFDFPEGIGPVECVNVEHEEVLLMPRWVDCKRATFKYGLGDEFINILKVLHTLGLDRTDKVRVKGVEVSPRDVVAAVLPDPATVGPRMKGKTCAGLWVTGTGKDGAAAVDVPLPRGRQRVDDARVRPPVRGLADRDQPGRRARAARRAAPGRAPACSARRRSTPCRSSTCSPSTAAPGARRSSTRRNPTSQAGHNSVNRREIHHLAVEVGTRGSLRCLHADGDLVARPEQALRRGARRRRPRPRDRGRRVLLDARPVGLRQDHGAAADRRLRAAHRRPDHARRRRRHRPAAVRPRREHRLPGLRDLPAHERARRTSSTACA